MSRSNDDEKSHWEQVQENFDLMFARMNDLWVIQQDLKKQMEANSHKVDRCMNEQQFIAQQVQANGQVVAHLTIRQFDQGNKSEGSVSLVFKEEQPFTNMFAHDKQPRALTAPPIKQPNNHKSESLPHHTLPKMHVPKFEGEHPKLWIKKCHKYFSMYSILEKLWVTAASMHLEGNAAKWFEAYELDHPTITWTTLRTDIQAKFGSDDYRSALTDLIALRQTGTVEEYTAQFQALQYDIMMHSGKYDDLHFATQYVAGLKDDIKSTMEPQVPITVDRAALIAKIQQKVLDRNKHKFQRNTQATRQTQNKPEAKSATSYGNIWRDKQSRDHRKANNLCIHCGEKFEPGHLDVCTKRNKPQLNTLALNDLDREISEDVLNEMAIEELITEDFCQLSLNAISGTESSDCIKLQSTVQNKTMLILVGTGSSYSFVSSQFVQLTKLSTSPIPS